MSQRITRPSIAVSEPVDVTAGKLRDVSKLFLDSQKLIVLRDSIASARRPRLDLSRAGRDREIRDERVFRFRLTGAR